LSGRDAQSGLESVPAEFERRLERLPVPELEDTCALYLRFVQPLVTEAEFAVTERAVADFLGPGGEGEVLQRRLLRWSKTPGVDNWLDLFWDDWYLCDDTPLVVNVSPGFVLARANRPQIERAARLLAAALRFKELVDREQLEPDRANGDPLCMREYSRLLSATRTPGEDRDRVERHPGSRHIVVVRANRFFSLDALDEDGRVYPVEELERGLQRIVDAVDAEGVPVGAVTTDRRRTWARVREDLLESTTTQASLGAIERAILVLVLDRGAAPPGPRSAEAARMSLHGDASERWFDKSIQLVVAANGVAGICMEHAGFDGSTVLRFGAFLVENEDRPQTDLPASAPARPPAELRFELHDRAHAAIDRSRRAATELVGRTDLALLDFEHFGKVALVPEGVSPDGFVQMAFQLAYFTLTGATASTYESVSTKRFLHGRTEAMRSVSPESVAFVRSLGGSRAATARAAELLRAAVANHAETVARCRDGRGVDRHLLGLRRMLEPDEPVPALFADKGYERLSRSVLSTSALPSSPGVELTCFGPVVDEGFGLSYTIHDDRICCVVTNFHGLAGAFVGELERSLVEMRAVLSET
jgi:carnitine O-acetyltransferase